MRRTKLKYTSSLIMVLLTVAVFFLALMRSTYLGLPLKLEHEHDHETATRQENGEKSHAGDETGHH